MTTLEIFKNARAAVSEIRNLSTEIKNAAIETMAIELINSTDEILKNNAIDIEKAKGVISDAMIDRLALSVERI